MADGDRDTEIQSIVQRCQEGDLAAFAALFTHFQDRVYDLACAVLKDEAEAEDALQDTFLRAFERIADFRGESSFETWLVAIAVNRCRDRLRRRKARRALPLESLKPRWLARVIGLGQDPEVVLEWREGRRRLRRMLQEEGTFIGQPVNEN